MATKSIWMSNTWRSTFSLYLFILTDKPSFCLGQSDLLNLFVNVELSWKYFGVTRVNFSFYLILIYNNIFQSSCTAPQKQSFKIFIGISSRIPSIIFSVMYLFAYVLNVSVLDSVCQLPTLKNERLAILDSPHPG